MAHGPCSVLLAAAIGVAVTTGQPSRILGAVACIVVMMVTMGAMGGHDHHRHERSRCVDGDGD